jgi:hypothetical protein
LFGFNLGLPARVVAIIVSLSELTVVERLLSLPTHRFSVSWIAHGETLDMLLLWIRLLLWTSLLLWLLCLWLLVEAEHRTSTTERISNTAYNALCRVHHLLAFLLGRQWCDLSTFSFVVLRAWAALKAWFHVTLIACSRSTIVVGLLWVLAT